MIGNGVPHSPASKKEAFIAYDLGYDSSQQPQQQTHAHRLSPQLHSATSSPILDYGTPGSDQYSRRRNNPADISQFQADSILPTHSPPHSTFPSMSIQAGQQQARRFAAGSFDPYNRGVADAELDSQGTFVSSEKAREAGFAPVSEKITSRNSSLKGGKYAAMIPVQRPPSTPLENVRWLFQQEEFVLLFYTLLSLFTRLYRIGRSNTVIWDEAHFGKFGSHYLKHEFYFDVHPPLGKMLVGLAGLLSGYHGQFDFKSGETYPADVNFLGMRVILACFGAAMVPLAYSTSGCFGWNWRTRHFIAIMVLCDNAWLVISRFILLDSMLLCFTCTTVQGLAKFNTLQDRPFTKPWWFWLSFTGLSIGCVASVKWVGLFVTALVGVFTVEDLWEKFGDLRMPVRTYIRHWCARILCLIVIPILVYMASFKAHFAILSRSGPGDAQMSSLFQAHLRGNDFAKAPLEAAYGSKVTFKNMGYGGGLLHSHVQTYPVGSFQQQVTCYHYKDNNNDFIITPLWEDEQLPADYETSSAPIRMVKNGDVIRLVHEQTKKNLHSHPIAAPITKENYEVAGYGDEKIGDSNDYWVVEVVDDMNHGKVAKGDPIRSLTTRMRFKHRNLGCYLYAANAVLPQWGWKQVEVSCTKENNPKDEHTFWNIESHVNPRLPAADTKLFRSPFLRDFIHLNVAMLTSNNALIPDQDKFDVLASTWDQWPFLWNGLRMNSWADNSIKYYLIGNPIIWWSSSASLFVFIATALYYYMRLQRRVADLSPADLSQFIYVGKLALIGFIFHIVPFISMSRVCYLHHFLPILYFSVIMLAHLMDHFFWNPSTARYTFLYRSDSLTHSKEMSRIRRPFSEGAKNLVFVIAVGSVLGAFLWLRGTAYGMDGDIHKHRGMQWRKSWNIYDL